MLNASRILNNYLIFFLLFISGSSIKAGLNNFTPLIFVDEWLIERKVVSTINEIKCRASIPSHANWFGARVRLGPNNELIKPIWIFLKAEQLNDLKLVKVRRQLDACRSGFLFLPDNL